RADRREYRPGRLFRDVRDNQPRQAGFSKVRGHPLLRAQYRIARGAYGDLRADQYFHADLARHRGHGGDHEPDLGKTWRAQCHLSVPRPIDQQGHCHPIQYDTQRLGIAHHLQPIRMFRIAVVMLFSVPLALQGQQVLALYDGAVPNSIPASVPEHADLGADGILRVSNVSTPTLTVYRPAAGTNTGKAMIICPGGGYRILAMSHEGHDVAEALADAGITAFVLKYRLPSDEIMQDKSIGPLQDAQRAIQLVRERATE